MTDSVEKLKGPRGSIDLATENTVVQCDGFNAPDCTRAVISEFLHQAKAAGLSLVPSEGVEWQPMETAPRDGTWFLAWIPEHEDDYGDRTGGWLEQWAFHEHLGKFARARHTYSDPLIYTLPSHWMPLPTPEEG